MKTALLAGGLTLAVLIAYHNTFSVPLLLDDRITIADNPTIHHFLPLRSLLLPPGNIPSAGRPLLNLSFALNYAVGGKSVFGYHVVNLLIHVLAGLTLFGLVRRTLVLPSLQEKFGRAALPLAMAIALLWTLHPLLTESVTYISERAESLMGLFYLLTFYCFVRGASVGPSASVPPRPALRPGSPRAQGIAGQQARASRPQNFWYGSAIAACALGMTSKEIMVTAPVLVFLFDRTFLAGTFRAAWKQRWKAHLGLAATWLVLAYCVLHANLQARNVGYGGSVTWWTYALTESKVVVKYFSLAFWPHPLVFDYGTEIMARGIAPVLPSALLLIILLTAAVIALRRWPASGFLGAWFFVVLAPTSSVVPVAEQPMAESRMYLPLVALIVLGVMALYRWLGRNCLPLLFILAAGYGWLTVLRNGDYHSEFALWTDTLAKAPGSARAYHNLGTLLEAQPGRLADAIKYYERALQLKPDFAEAHNNLGGALAKLPGRLPDAITQLEEAVRLNPSLVQAHVNLGNVLSDVPGRQAEAIAQLQEALRLNPDSADTHYNLGSVLMGMPGHEAEAIAQLQAALQINPNFEQAHYNLALVLMRNPAQMSEAIPHLEAALKLRPENAEAHNNLGIALSHQPGRLPDAISQYETALRLRPDDAAAHYNLALALALTPGRRSDAIDHLQAVLQLRPDFTPARQLLRRLQAMPLDMP